MFRLAQESITNARRHATGATEIDVEVWVDADHATSLPGVWAGGDCIGSGVDLTVQAVEDGKRAARAIDRTLAAQTASRGQAHG